MSSFNSLPSLLLAAELCLELCLEEDYCLVAGREDRFLDVHINFITQLGYQNACVHPYILEYVIC